MARRAHDGSVRRRWRKSRKDTGLWRYAHFLPLTAGAHDDARTAQSYEQWWCSSGVSPVTLGEGDTPLVPLPRWGERHGLRRVYAKLEYVSPTGSFKDRGAAVVVAKAAEWGVGRMVEDSSGNAGASIAAYSARAGITCDIFCSGSGPRRPKYGPSSAPEPTCGALRAPAPMSPQQRSMPSATVTTPGLHHRILIGCAGLARQERVTTRRTTSIPTSPQG